MTKHFHTLIFWLNQNLPGLPKTMPLLKRMARQQGWQAINGEYPLSALPLSAKTAFLSLNKITTALPTVNVVNNKSTTVSLSANPHIFDDRHLSDSQRSVGLSRCVVVDFIEGLIISQKASSISNACNIFCDLFISDHLPDDIANFALISAGKNQKLAIRTVNRWVIKKQAFGKTALAPKKRSENAPPVWAKLFLGAYGQPQKPSVYEAVEAASAKCLELGVSAPTLTSARRLLAKLSTVDKLRGRISPRDMRGQLPFVRRRTDHINPADVYSSDGHTFKGEVLHPISGKAFRPEVTSIIDEKTRMCVGWSTAESENTFGTIEAMRMAFVRHGIPAIWYVDNGKGFNNHMFDDNLTGFLTRLNITKKNSTAYNSQARGKVERSHQSIWVKAAKTLDSFMGKKMDPYAKQQNFKKTRKDMVDFGTSSKMITFCDFKNLCQKHVDKYNNTSHSGLDKITCPTTGRRRHMSPAEAWKFYSTDLQIPKLTADEATDTFRPYEIRKVNRGELSIGGQLYFHEQLAHYNRLEVLVGYDIMDASKVWVRELIRNNQQITQGRLICVAQFEANHVYTQPKSIMTKAIDRRNDGRLKRIDAKRQGLLDEMGVEKVIDHKVKNSITSTSIFEKIAVAGTKINPSPTLSDGDKTTFLSDFDLLKFYISKKSPSHQEILHSRKLLGLPGMLLRCEVSGIDVDALTEKWAELQHKSAH